jgi:hypothetical protein
MTRAFLDTTVLTYALLKTSEQGHRAVRSFRRFTAIDVPMYAVKEFKAGPLRAYMWLHNRVVTTKSWSEAIGNIGGVARQHNLSTTAIQAVAEFSSSLAKASIGTLARSERGDITLEELQQREATIWLRTKVMQAWRKRNKPPFNPVRPLRCYAELEPTIRANGLLDYTPLKCSLAHCCLKEEFVASLEETKLLHGACVAVGGTEMTRRGKVLREMVKRPRSELSEQNCRTLGDAVFALQCPATSVILTTNLTHHRPLAEAIGKKAEAP